jgi:hypothetical protein
LLTVWQAPASMERMIAVFLTAVICQPPDVAEWNAGKRKKLSAGDALSVQVPASWAVDTDATRARSATAMVRLLVSEPTIEWSTNRSVDDDKRILPNALTRYMPPGVASERRFITVGSRPMIVQDYSADGVHGRVACVLTGNRIGVVNVVYDESRAAELSEFVDGILQTTESQWQETGERSAGILYAVGGLIAVIAVAGLLAFRRHRSATLLNDRNLKRVRR